jgi:hypothetical protein
LARHSYLVFISNFVFRNEIKCTLKRLSIATFLQLICCFILSSFFIKLFCFRFLCSCYIFYSTRSTMKIFCFLGNGVKEKVWWSFCARSELKVSGGNFPSKLFQFHLDRWRAKNGFKVKKNVEFNFLEFKERMTKYFLFFEIWSDHLVLGIGKRYFNSLKFRSFGFNVEKTKIRL